MLNKPKRQDRPNPLATFRHPIFATVLVGVPYITVRELKAWRDPDFQYPLSVCEIRTMS
jgi:hypothetical protein